MSQDLKLKEKDLLLEYFNDSYEEKIDRQTLKKLYRQIDKLQTDRQKVTFDLKLY